jgi:DNA-directed RNA polymerase specialized sigma24 family protein
VLATGPRWPPESTSNTPTRLAAPIDLEHVAVSIVLRCAVRRSGPDSAGDERRRIRATAPASAHDLVSLPHTTLGARVDGAEALTQARAAIQEMPEALRQVIVERDVEGRTPEQVRATLRLSGAEESAMLNEARGRVRARLERYFAELGDDHERA